MQVQYSLKLGGCAGSHPAGSVQFRNVGDKDRNEGAPNVVTIALCASHPGSFLSLSGGACQGQPHSQTRFRNVAKDDVGEGAPTYVSMSLCERGPVNKKYRLTATGPCPSTMAQLSRVQFKNVGDNDRNEGAPNVVVVRLCGQQ